jgi:hypothetical protein
MDTTQTNSPASTGSEGQTTSSPSTQVAPNQTPAQAVFAGSQAPDWVKSAGLEGAHNKAEQKVAPQTQQTGVQPGSTGVQPGSTGTQPAAVQTPTPPAQQPAMDPTAIAKAVAEGLRGVLPQQQQTQPQLTDEQLRQQLGVFTATEETYEQLLGVKPDSPARVAALNNVLQAVAKQAVTISNLMTQKALADYQQSLNPYITAVQTAEADRQKSLFFKDYPQLTGFEQVVQEQYQLAKMSGVKFPTVEAARKYVADKAIERLKSVGVNPQAPAAQPTQTTQTTSPNTSRQMTTTSVGGRSGASATGKSPANTVEAVWGNR